MNSLFRISERNHLGTLLMSELAGVYKSGDRVTLQQIAKSLGISDGYLEEIASSLKKAGLVQGRKGPNGGYALTAKPQRITIEQILTALEGPIIPVACQGTKSHCPISDKCHSRVLWSRMQKNLLAALRKTTLADLINV